MRRYNIDSWALFILTVITLALAAPILEQAKGQASLDEVHVPRGMITVLGKRVVDNVLGTMLDGAGIFWNELEEHAPEGHAPPPNEAGVQGPEVHAPPPNLAGVQVPAVDEPMDDPQLNFWAMWALEGHVPDVQVPQHGPEGSDRESMVIDDDAPPASPESGNSLSPPMSPGSSTKFEDYYTPQSSTGSSTEVSGSDSDSDRWSTISNAPSAESQSKNLEAAESALIQLKGKAKVERR